MHAYARQFAALVLLLAGGSATRAAEPAWMRLPAAQPLDFAKLAYFEFATKNLSPEFSPKNVLKFGQTSRKFSVPDGEYRGDWTFFAAVGDQLPRSAWRIQISNAPPYRVTAERYCSGEECDRLASELRKMPAPRPAGGESLLSDWRRIVSTEECDRLLPVATPGPIFPPEEMRRGITGNVTVKAYQNQCGDVRDALLEKSSGNRNLDRAALKRVLRWRVPVMPRGRAGWSLQTLRFTLDGPGSPIMSPPLQAFPAEGDPTRPKKR